MRNKELEASVRGMASPCQRGLATVLGVCAATERTVQPQLVFAEMPWLQRRARASDADGDGDGAASDEEKDDEEAASATASSATSSTLPSSTGSGAKKAAEEATGTEGALNKASTAVATVAHVSYNAHIGYADNPLPSLHLFTPACPPPVPSLTVLFASSPSQSLHSPSSHSPPHPLRRTSSTRSGTTPASRRATPCSSRSATTPAACTPAPRWVCRGKSSPTLDTCATITFCLPQ